MKDGKFFQIECIVDKESLKLKITIFHKLIIFLGSIASIVALILFLLAD